VRPGRRDQLLPHRQPARQDDRRYQPHLGTGRDKAGFASRGEQPHRIAEPVAKPDEHDYPIADGTGYTQEVPVGSSNEVGGTVAFRGAEFLAAFEPVVVFGFLADGEHVADSDRNNRLITMALRARR
jgi:hypothetical protein